MKRFLFTLWALALAVGLSTAEANTPVVPQPRPTDAHLFGHVVDKATHDHLPYVSVVVVGTTIGVVTDATGHYLIKNMTPGTYTIEVSAVGYVSASKKVKMVAGQTTELEFELAEDSVTLDQIVVSSNRSETLKREAPSFSNTLVFSASDRRSGTGSSGRGRSSS